MRQLHIRISNDLEKIIKSKAKEKMLKDCDIIRRAVFAYCTTVQVANQDAPEYDIQRVFDVISVVNPSERNRSKHKDRAISQVIQEHGVVPVLEKLEKSTVRNLIPDT